jgi:outer membrane protein assembly factor BamB
VTATASRCSQACLTLPGGERLAGLTPGTNTLRWLHSVPPDNPLRAKRASLLFGNVQLAGGRVVAKYDDLEDHQHLIALDARTGDTRWDVVTKRFWNERRILTPPRLYEIDPPRLDVRDAATGQLLGGVGAEGRSSPIQ